VTWAENFALATLGLRFQLY